jgi:hypothetical protein
MNWIAYILDKLNRCRFAKTKYRMCVSCVVVTLWVARRSVSAGNEFSYIGCSVILLFGGDASTPKFWILDNQQVFTFSTQAVKKAAMPTIDHRISFFD